MAAGQVVTIAGLVLTMTGALMLAIGDRFPGRVTWDTAKRGMPNRLNWPGFALIAAGTAVQIVGVAIT